MISERLQDAMNEQVNAELYSAYLYLAMGAQFEEMNLSGFANWMRRQVQEELAHAAGFYDHINERGGRVVLKAIEAPPKEWESPLAAFMAANEHEQKVTGLINNLVELAEQEKNRAAGIFLQWYVSEQVEEEASTDGVVQKLKLVGDQGAGLLMLDQELAARTFTPPTIPGTSMGAVAQ